MRIKILLLILLIVVVGLLVVNKSTQTKWFSYLSGGLIGFCLLYLFYISYEKNTVAQVAVMKEAGAPPIEIRQIIEDKPYQFIEIKDEVMIDAPLIPQLPELPRGCEVTSLAMLLQHAGVDVDKMTLAKQVKKDPTPYKKKNGKIYFGNPHRGFVGNMYTFNKPGLGVYHEPIMELAEQYLPGRIVNLTGQSFEELKIPLSDGRPVWVIINANYKELDDSYFETWHTPDGPIKVTYKEHSVLITGYDDKYVYFNDPLLKRKKAPIRDFEKAWVQMGSQALTYLYE